MRAASDRSPEGFSLQCHSVCPYTSAWSLSYVMASSFVLLFCILPLLVIVSQQLRQLFTLVVMDAHHVCVIKHLCFY